MKWFYRNWLYLLAVTLPFERIPSYDLALGGRSVTIRASFILALIIVGWAAVVTLKRRSLPKFSAPDKWLGVYALVMVASTGIAASRGRALTVIFATGLLLALAVVIEHTLRRFSLSVLYRCIITVTVVACLFGLYQFIGDSFGLPTAWTGLKDIYTKHVFGFPRIQSTGLEPLYFASFLLLPIMLLAGSIYAGRAGYKQYGLLGLVVMVLALTLSRGGIYGALGAVLLLVVLMRKEGSFRRLAAMLVMAGLGAGCALGLIALTTRVEHAPASSHAVTNYVQQSTHLTSEVGSADDDRSANRRLALQAFRSHPLLGVGVGNFGTYAQAHDVRYAQNNKTIVNNEYLEILAETGLAGLVALVGFGVALLVGVIRSWKRLHGEQKLWAAALLATLAGMVIQYYAFSTLYIIQLWFAAGLLMGLVRLQSIKQSRQA